ncbi:MAG: 50S ribosomal protein L10 [Acetilactobacillus jinshanensis]
MKKAVLDAKKQEVKKFADLLKNSKSAIVVNYRGLKVGQMTKLRKALYKASASFHVVKNNILIRAAKQDGFKGFEKFSKGPTAVAFATKDPIAPSKIILKMIKATKGTIEFKGGIIDGKMVPVKTIQTYASLPSRKELLSTLANVLQDPIRKVALIVKALADKKSKAGKGAA